MVGTGGAQAGDRDGKFMSKLIEQPRGRGDRTPLRLGIVACGSMSDPVLLVMERV